jgi:hypothetical protein
LSDLVPLEADLLGNASIRFSNSTRISQRLHVQAFGSRLETGFSGIVSIHC